jgi:hypothetical protein
VAGTPFPILLCEKGHVDFHPTWKSSDGDTNFEDPTAYNSLTSDQQKRVDDRLGDTDEALKSRFREFITGSLKTGDLGAAMVDRFYDGTQDPFRHPRWSPLSNMAVSSSSFLEHAANVRDKIKALLPPMPVPSGYDYGFLEKRIDVPTVNFAATSSALASFVTFQTGDELTLKSLIGGTQGLRIYLQNIFFWKDHSKVPNTFSVQLRYEIFDNFGVGNDDIYTGWKGWEDYHDALVAFWVLQHMRKGHKPFVNWIEVVTISLSKL